MNSARFNYCLLISPAQFAHLFHWVWVMFDYPWILQYIPFWGLQFILSVFPYRSIEQPCQSWPCYACPVTQTHLAGYPIVILSNRDDFIFLSNPITPWQHMCIPSFISCTYLHVGILQSRCSGCVDPHREPPPRNTDTSNIPGNRTPRSR